MRRVLIWAFVLGTTFVLGCTGRPGTSGSDRSQLGRPSPSPPAIQRRIAVLDFRNTSQHKELSWLSQAVAETLVTKLAGVASIHVVERSQLDKVIKEQRRGLTDLFDPSKAAKVGRLAGAQVVVIGGYVVFGKDLMFNLRFVDTETGIIQHTAQVQGGTSDGKTLFAALNRLADAAVESLEKKVVIQGGEKRVVKAAPVTLTPRERKRFAAPPARSLTAYELYGKGLEAYKKNRWREAEALFARALERDPGLADAAGWRAKVLKGLGRYAEALDLNARALALYREKRDEKKVAAILNNIGLIHEMQGRYDAAMRLYEESLAIKRRLGDEAGIAATLNNIGGIHDDQGRYGEAMRWYKESLAIIRRLGNQAGIATTLNNIGGIHNDQGRYDAAMRLYEESLAIKRRLGDEAGIAATLNNIGGIHYKQGRYGEAMRWYEESLSISRRLGNQAVIAATLNNIGLIRNKQGRYGEAMRRYEESLVIDRRLGNQAGIAVDPPPKVVPLFELVSAPRCPKV